MLRIVASWCSGEEVLRNAAVQFFKQLYQEDTHHGRPKWNSGIFFPPLEDFDFSLLDQPVSNDEIKEALFTMGGLKAPSLDGCTFLSELVVCCWKFLVFDG